MTSLHHFGNLKTIDSLEKLKRTFYDFCISQMWDAIARLNVAEFPFSDGTGLMYSSSAMLHIKDSLHIVKDRVYYILKIFDEEHYFLDILFNLLKYENTNGCYNVSFFSDYEIFKFFLEYLYNELSNKNSKKNELFFMCLESKWEDYQDYIVNASHWFFLQTYNYN